MMSNMALRIKKDAMLHGHALRVRSDNMLAGHVLRIKKKRARNGMMSGHALRVKKERPAEVDDNDDFAEGLSESEEQPTVGFSADKWLNRGLEV